MPGFRNLQRAFAPVLEAVSRRSQEIWSAQARVRIVSRGLLTPADLLDGRRRRGIRRNRQRLHLAHLREESTQLPLRGQTLRNPLANQFLNDV